MPDARDSNHRQSLSRRRFLVSFGAGGLGTLTLLRRAVASAGREKRPINEAFDGAMISFMTARAIPGGALSVVKQGRLIYASAYGWADRERRLPVKAETLFRIASVSKPFTAVAVLQLIGRGKLSFETRLAEELDLPSFSGCGASIHPSLEKVTVRHLLQHTGGWDHAARFDPMFRSRWIADRMGIAGPPGPRDILRFMFGQPLDFEPGTRHAYSNFGYCVLGRLIEQATGSGYEAWVQGQVLAPIGIGRMRLGATLEAKRASDEAHYYSAQAGHVESIFPGTSTKVPPPYGGFCLEAMDAHGGWVASVIDLARFAAALDTGKPAGMAPEVLAAMTAPPPAPVSRRSDGTLQDHWYGCGWGVRSFGGGRINTWHAGSLPGTYGLLVRRWDGLSWAAVFNQRSAQAQLPDEEIDGALHRAADSVGEWPTEDLFGKFASR
jgi:N-acyl-D-amino-acid deacylase